MIAEGHSLENNLLSEINVNNLGFLTIIAVPGLINSADLNNNAGATTSILGIGEITNQDGVINNQGSDGNPAKVDIEGKLINKKILNNKENGIITIMPGGLLQNVKPGFIQNENGAEIIIEDGGAKKGRIFGDGTVTNLADDSITNFGIIDISGLWKNFGTIDNNGIINLFCEGTIEPFGNIIGTGEINELPCNREAVRGEIIPIDSIALLVAGLQTSYSILTAFVVIGSVTFGIIYYTKRK